MGKILTVISSRKGKERVFCGEVLRSRKSCKKKKEEEEAFVPIHKRGKKGGGEEELRHMAYKH